MERGSSRWSRLHWYSWFSIVTRAMVLLGALGAYLTPCNGTVANWFDKCSAMYFVTLAFLGVGLSIAGGIVAILRALWLLFTD